MHTAHHAGEQTTSFYGRKLTVRSDKQTRAGTSQALLVQNIKKKALLHRLDRPGAGQAQLVHDGLTD
jgi:hypothetical protein